MKRHDRFWDRIAERYARQPVADEAAYQEKLRVTRTYFRPDSEVLEVGCGTGSTAIAHAPHVRHIRATDLSAKMIEIARGKVAAAGVDNLTFEKATIETLEVPPASLDAVLALSLLHLLEDRHAAIAKAYEWLRPGGVFVTSTACLGDTMAWFRFVGPIGHALGLIPMVRVFTSDELVQDLTRAGFEIDHRWAPARGKAVFIVAKKPPAPAPAPA